MALQQLLTQFIMQLKSITNNCIRSISLKKLYLQLTFPQIKKLQSYLYRKPECRTPALQRHTKAHSTRAIDPLLLVLYNNFPIDQRLEIFRRF